MLADSYRIQITLQAAAQLEEIFRYIAEDSPANTGRMIERLLEAVDDLDIFPHRYPAIARTIGLDEIIRSMPVPPYLIRYTVDEARRVVMVLSVRHAARKAGL